MTDNTVDIKTIREVMQLVKDNKPLGSFDLLKLKAKGRKIENQILEIARKQFSEANYVTNDVKEIGQINKFNVHDVKGTVIAFLWVNEEGKATILPNENVYPIRMS